MAAFRSIFLLFCFVATACHAFSSQAISMFGSTSRLKKNQHQSLLSSSYGRNEMHQACNFARSSFALKKLRATSKEEEEDDEEEPEETQSSSSAAVARGSNTISTPSPLPTPPTAARVTAATAARRRLDPLVSSLTRMDAETLEAPTVNVPIWGELILDKSLFILLPVAAFAVLGFVATIYVALNSGDAVIESMAATGNALLQNDPSSSSSLLDESSCRGLCSDQQADLDGLRTFMQSLRK